MFEEIGLAGQSDIDLHEGSCLFTSLKFKTTSFNHGGSSFHLLVIVYFDPEPEQPRLPVVNELQSVSEMKNEAENGLSEKTVRKPVILASKISAPIFITSRKPNQKDKSKVSESRSLFLTSVYFRTVHFSTI